VGSKATNASDIQRVGLIDDFLIADAVSDRCVRGDEGLAHLVFSKAVEMPANPTAGDLLMYGGTVFNARRSVRSTRQRDVSAQLQD
jgi:hypothetical protein